MNCGKAGQLTQILEVKRSWPSQNRGGSSMVVRLQTEGGELKQYSTVYGEGLVGHEPGHPRKYVTKCGQEWKFNPGPRGGCHHLNCAIYLAEQQKRYGYGSFKLSVIFSIVLNLLMGHDFDLGLRLALSGFSVLVGFGFLISGLVGDVRFKELVEYRDKGTIDSMKARQIYEDL